MCLYGVWCAMKTSSHSVIHLKVLHQVLSRKLLT